MTSSAFGPLASRHRNGWSEIPPDLEERYAAIRDLDDSFDPLGLSFTLGPAADLEARPDWGVGLDFEEVRA